MTTAEWPEWLLVLIIPLLYLSYVINAAFHEGGHALACVAQGNHIISWSIFALGRSHLDCTNHSSALFAMAGSLSSVLAWTAGTAIFLLLGLPHQRSAYWLRFLSTLWAAWSFWCLGELVLWSLQTVEHPPQDDGARFVAATGLDPRFVTASSLAVFAVLVIALVLPTAWTIYHRSHQ